MGSAVQLLVFSIDAERFALRLPSVEKVVRAVKVTPLPAAPEIVLGVINVAGRIVPVFNIRKRFRLPAKELETGDQFIIARTRRRTVAIPADFVSGLVEAPEDKVAPAAEVLPRLDYVEGVAKLEDGMALIHDLDRFLSLEEDGEIERAMDGRPPHE